MTGGTGERGRKPIGADLPDDLRRLLAEMERLADEKNLGFPKILEEIHKAGAGKYNPSMSTRWRAGQAFPPERVVRAWVTICEGDVDHVMMLYPRAEKAYAAWRAQTR